MRSRTSARCRWRRCDLQEPDLLRSAHEGRTAANREIWSGGPADVPDARTGKILRFLPDRAERYLDIGCSAGAMTVRYAAACGARDVHGLDVARIEEATARGVQARAFDLNGPEPLPYGDGSFDLVTCLETLEHLTDPERIVAETHRVLRPGGVFVVDVPRLDSWMTIVLLALGFQPSGVECSLRRRYGAMNRESVLTGHVSYFTRRAIRELLLAAGFTVEGEAGAGMGKGYLADRRRRGLRVGTLESLAMWINDRLPFRKDFLILRATRPR